MKHRVWLLRLWRFSVLAIAAVLIRWQAEPEVRPTPLDLEAAKPWFPSGRKISGPDGETGAQYVTDAFGDTLGFLVQTFPRSRDIIGYCGPSNTLLAVDRQGRVIGAKLLSSGDTEEHVRRVLESERYWKSLQRLPGDSGGIAAVSGATLTSTAITRGAMRALGLTERASMLFPYPLELVEVQELFTEATRLEPVTTGLGGVLVFDGKGSTLGRVLRTSPSSDAVNGYKGPSDTLIALDPDGRSLRELRVRDSFESEEYLSSVTNDSRFLPAFEGRSVESMAQFDFQREGISGVSGATRSSLSILEGVKRRLNDAQELGGSAIRLDLRNGLLLFIVIAGGILPFSPWRGIPWVRITWQCILIGYLGLFAGDMLSQALLAGWASHGVPWRNLPGLTALAAAALLVPLFTGKQLYCHHLCPHGAAQQWCGKLTRKKLQPHPAATRWLGRLPAALLALIFLLVLARVPLNLAAFEPFDAWVFRAAGWATIALAVVGLVASVFYPLAYCKFGCPTGALLRFLRTGASQDGFGGRDWMALCLLGVGAILVLAL